jgi:hypothetical protein
MMLLTKANRAALPPLYSNEKVDDPVAVVKFFNPTGSFTWYATEFDGDDTFFGLVDGGFEKELGYFSLAELSAFKGRFGLGIERDRGFPPTPLSKLR